MSVEFRPLTTWPRPFTKNRRGGNFSTSYLATVAALGYEIAKLGGKNIVIQTSMDESDIRLDGWPRANARKPSHPGVVVSFESRQGPLSFACDEFAEWRDNLRGIALTLERLRLVDLYGVTKSGEQYTGWKALPPQSQGEADEGPFPSRYAAAVWLARVSGIVINPMNPDESALLKAYRIVARRAHPDAPGGDAAEFRRLQHAKEMLKI